MNDTEFRNLMNKYILKLEKEPRSPWATEAYNFCRNNGISDGTYPCSFLTREQAWEMLSKYYKKFCK